MSKIGVFGGTFDPIHVGHLVMATEFMHGLRLDAVLFTPAGQPPHKPDAVVSSDDDRCSMIEAAIAGRPGFELSTIDLDLPGPSYTVDLLTRLATIFDDAEFYFLLGGDSLRDFHTWHQPHRVPEMAIVAVAGRPGVALDLQQAIMLTPSLEQRIVVIDSPQIDISSTDIRNRVCQGRPIWYRVPEAVERYIRDKRLYQVSR